MSRVLLVVAIIVGVVGSSSAQDALRPSPSNPAADRGPLVIQAEVIDPAGATQADVEVIVALEYWQRSGIHRQVLERIRTDQAGRIRLEVVREGPGERLASARIWAHQPGRGVAESAIALSYKTPRPMRLTLGTPAQRAFTVVGPDGHPLAGIRVAPHSLVPEGGLMPAVFPRAWADHLAGITNAEGVATISDLPTRPEIARVEFAGPGIAPHLFTLAVGQANATIKLGGSGRLVGLARTESGRPIAGASVAVWLGAPLVSRPGAPRRTSAELSPVETIRFDPGPVESGPQGAFQTPPTLLTGSTYRVVVRKDGFEPIASDWVTLDGERAVVPPVRLRALRTVAGEVRERQGGPIAGARVFLPGGGPSTTTDDRGHFELKEVPPRKAIVLVEKPGFRLQGWPVEPVAAGTPRTFISSRTTEPPDPAMKPMADPIPPEEARTLANRLLEPYLRDLNEKDDRIKLQALIALTDLAPDRAVDLLPTISLEEGTARYAVRAGMAARIAEVDRPRAEALLASTPLPSIPLDGLIYMARVLPPSLNAQKRRLVEQAMVLLEKMPRPALRIRKLPDVAEIWLDLGEVERARLLLLEMKPHIDAMNPMLVPPFLAQLARIEPQEAESRFRKLAEVTLPKLAEPLSTRVFNLRERCLCQAVAAIASDHPAEVERLFNLMESRTVESSPYAMRLFRRLARVDPTRARRIAASLDGDAERACAWAFVALGLAELDRRAAGEALDRALFEIDRLRESGPEPESLRPRPIYSTNPAAMILPVVERIAPERLPDVFWRAADLFNRFEPENVDSFGPVSIGLECMLLARYDRETTAVLFEPMEMHLRQLAARGRGGDRLTVLTILGMGTLDPRGAVALVESLVSDRPLGAIEPVHEARLTLVRILAHLDGRRPPFVLSLLRVTLPLDD